MHLNALNTLLLASIVAAAPLDLASLDGLTEGSMLFTHGELAGQVVNMSTWKAMVEAEGIMLKAPPLDPAYYNFTAPEEVEEDLSELSLEKRQCSRTTAIITDRTERFVDWDVQMSPVVCGNGGPMDVTVTSGFTVANTIEIQGGGEATFIADRLSASFGVSFSRTWTTQYSVATRTTVNDGECGVIVTNPLTTRRYGRTMRGCPGSYTQIGTWIANDRGRGSYSGVEWVSGSITTCRKRQASAPLTRCRGQGEFR